jgi:hypothetical protein
MQLKKGSLPLFLLLTLSLLATACTVSADIGTFQILPLQQQTITLNLNNGDSVSGTVVVNGQGLIDFWISDPQDINVTNYGNVGQTDFSMNAQTSGTFTLHMLNTSADSSVSVTINYNATYRILGMPQELFLVLVIVGIALLFIIVWALSSRM